MTKIPVFAAALLLTPTLVHAVPTTWELLNDQLAMVGTFVLDIDTQTTSNAQINGDLGVYTISSTFMFLNAAGQVGGYPVNNYFKFFSTEAGKVYRSDFGGGEYSEVRVNDSAIDIGTLGVLEPGGGLYDAYIHEIYNFDETNVYCGYYDEIYDDQGEYIGQGSCLYFYQDTSYNTESGYWYEGYYLRSAPAVADVAIPPTGWLLLMGLAGLGFTGKLGLPRFVRSTATSSGAA